MDSLSEQSSSVHGDDVSSLNFGFNLGNNDQQGGLHNASQPAFTLPSVYSKIPVETAPAHKAQSTSPASNMVAPGSILLQEKKTLTIKVNEQDIYNGDENSLYDVFFRWQLILMSHGLQYAARAVAREGYVVTTAEAHERMGQELQFLFSFITERISSKTEKGRALIDDIMLACQEGTLLMSSGTGLVSLLCTSAQFKFMHQCDDVDEKLKNLKFPITATDVQIKRAMTTVKRLLFRLPEVSKGHVMRPFKVILDALPSECGTQKLLIETQMGLSGYMITAMAMKPPPWSQFQATVVATIMGARARLSSGRACINEPDISPPQGSSTQGEALALLAQAKAEAQALVSQAKSDAGKLKGGFGGKCWFCAGTHGDPKHACADCKAPKCPDCGKMICGHARAMSQSNGRPIQRTCSASAWTEIEPRSACNSPCPLTSRTRFVLGHRGSAICRSTKMLYHHRSQVCWKFHRFRFRKMGNLTSSRKSAGRR